MEWVLDGVVRMILSLMTATEDSLGDALAGTGMSPNAEAAFWGVIIVLCLIVAVRLLSGWIRNLAIIVILALILHVVVTHGIGTVA
jgi:hypothetical protein